MWVKSGPFYGPRGGGEEEGAVEDEKKEEEEEEGGVRVWMRRGVRLKEFDCSHKEDEHVGHNYRQREVGRLS